MGLLGIGVSGLIANRTALNVTGNNIANADVPEYSRQRAEFSTRPEQQFGFGYLGSGVGVTDIERQVEEFLIAQLRLDTANASQAETFLKNITQIDQILAEDASGLASVFEGFYESIEAMAADASSIPQRQLAIANTQILVDRLDSLYERFTLQNRSINEQLDTITDQITTLAASIAELNTAIEAGIAAANGSEPNQLLDERDELLRQMSELISITVTEETSGAVNVFIGSGQPLVVGSTANAVDTAPSTRSVGSSEILFVGPGFSQVITDQVSGGQLGGLLAFRDGPLSDTINSIGVIALGVADVINQQHLKGIDLDGNLGINVFTDINDPLFQRNRGSADAGNLNPTTVNIDVNIDDVGQITNSEYVLNYTAAGYNVTRNNDGAVVASGAGLPVSVTTSDGFTINLSGAAIAAGDSFYIRPARTGADDINLELQFPQQWALASPVTTETDYGNIGTGSISAGEVLNVYEPGTTNLLPEFLNPGALTPPVMIRFTTPTDYEIYDNTNPLAPAGPIGAGTITPGVVNTITFGAGPAQAYQVEINGFPEVGDKFTIDYNTNGTRDNRNALAITSTRSQELLGNNTVSFEGANARLVGEVATATSQARIGQEAAEGLLIQSRSNRDAKSGVNLDEEASKLILFEQGYNANAQVINVARQIFDTLLSAFR
jgi:flagellar hook-associated protein 1 FlgK